VTRSDNSSDFRIHRQNLLALRPYVRLAHHLPGRLRIKVRPGVAAVQALLQHADVGMEALRQLLPGVRSLRFNALSGSMLLEYDPKIIPFALVDAFFRTTSAEEAGCLLDRLLSFIAPANKQLNQAA
jgi:hypothetical protein